LSKLPVVSGREMIRILSKIGFVIVGRKGSHARLKRRRGELAKETLRSILRQANLTVEDLLRLL